MILPLQNTNSKSVSLFVIATRDYVRYAEPLLASIGRYFNSSMKTQILLLTDSPVEHRNQIIRNPSVVLQQVPISSFGWPDASLLRFKLMLDCWDMVTGGLVMYLDADTVVRAEIGIEDLREPLTTSNQSDMVFVEHPGYYNRKRLPRLLFRTRIGPWETRRLSTAFVPISERHRYVCGGVFWGLRDSFFEFCLRLRDNIEIDLERGLIAKHNDESHINKWRSINRDNLASPEWAFAAGYSNLKGLQPRIEVIHKPKTFRKS